MKLFKIILLAVLLAFTSCVKDLDFNQVNELELTPSYTTSLVNFSVPQTVFLDPITGVEVAKTSSKIIFSAIEKIEEKHKKYLERVTVEFDIENPFDRNFQLDFKFVDKNGSQTYDFPVLDIQPNSTYETPHEINLINHPNLLNSVEAEITITLMPGTTIDQTIPKVFKFKSAGIFNFRITE